MRRLLPILFALLVSAAHAENPIGLMLSVDPAQDQSLLAARAAALGIGWYRPPNQFLDHWQPGQRCAYCRDLGRVGPALTITLRYGSKDAPGHLTSGPPADLAEFETRLAGFLQQWNPALLVVEDEENRVQRFSDRDDQFQGYRAELDSACKIAHRQKRLCANGGLSFEAAAGLTWFQLLSQGKPDLACDYAKRVGLRGTGTIKAEDLCEIRDAAQVTPSLREALLDHADRLIPIYAQSAIDAVNFHWFGSDAMALSQTIDMLARLTGKRVMSNELGQRGADLDPAHVRPLLRAAIAGRLLTAIWVSLDGPISRSLFDRDGRLRPAGEEFAHQMSGVK